MWPAVAQQVAVPASHQTRCRTHNCGELVTYMRVGVSPNHIGFFCAADHFQGGWTPHADFEPDGKYAGLLPAEWFEAPRKKRAKALMIRDGIRYETLMAANDACCFCRRLRPAQPKRQSYVRAWMQQNRPDVYRRVALAFDACVAAGEPIAATDWMRFMPEDVQIAVKHAIERSDLDADHVIPVWLLKEMRLTIETRMSKAAFSFLANDCCIPLCRSCNAGRPTNSLEPSNMLKDRYIQSKFGGNAKRAEQSKEFKALAQALEYAHAYLAQRAAAGA